MLVKSLGVTSQERVTTHNVLLMYHRITLEDDEDEDLDVEPAPRRPVLVMSDSLKKGLRQGISDILPHTVAQSVYVYFVIRTFNGDF